MGYIYKITNIVSKKCYIGETKSKNVESRWKQHINCIDRNKGCPALRDAVNKHGWEKFKFEVLIICFDEDRFEYEKQYIKKYNSQIPNGYNLTTGGEGGGFKGKKHSEETRMKLSEASRKYYENPINRQENSIRVKEAMKNINIKEKLLNSEKWKKAVEKMRDGGRINFHSIDSKDKIRQSVKKYFENNQTNIEKHRKAMAKTTGKKVCQYSLDGNFIAEYESIKEAGRKTEAHSDCIRKVIKGEIKTAKGFLWKLAE